MWEWQLSDSEVAELREQGDGLVLRFSALAARALGAPAGEPASDWGYALGVELQLSQARWAQCDPHALGRIADGRITLNGAPCGALPLPGGQTGAIELTLRFSNGAALRGTAQAWTSRFVAEPRFRESYAC